MRFIKGNGKEFVPPTVGNWIITLQGFIYIWKIVYNEKFQYLYTRNLNQDAIEIFFGCIRSHGVRNVNPTTNAFTNSFKTLIINNFVSSHSPNANCEEGESEGALNILNAFLNDNVKISIGVEIVDENNCPIKFKETSYSQLNIDSYIAGYLARGLLKKLKNCRACKTFLLTKQSETHHELINARAYNANALLRPNSQYTTLFGKCTQLAHYLLPIMCEKSHVLIRISSEMYKYINIQSSCSVHDLQAIFIEKFLNLYVFTWVKNVNLVLKGQGRRNINDSIKETALDKCNKIKRSLSFINAIINNIKKIKE
ncbi:uncharacterized protein [Onthophagus taurus]|uniref:uncharacterized protein n=1 Tax=Onthophagus taurus TaxID=166361 RepID=UPI0039BDC5B6